MNQIDEVLHIFNNIIYSTGRNAYNKRLLKQMSLTSAYERPTRKWFDWLKLRKLHVHPNNLLLWINELNNRTRKGITLKINTIQTYMYAVRKFLRRIFEQSDYSWDGRVQLMLENTFKQLPKLRPEIKKLNPERIISDKEFRTLQTIATPRNFLMYSFIRITGCRGHEMSGIKIHHLKLTRTFNKDKTKLIPLYFVRLYGKGNKERTVPVSFKLISAIKRIFHDGGKSWKNAKYLFCQIKNQERYIHQSNVSRSIIRDSSKIRPNNPISLHDLRHTWATKQLEKGKISIKEVSSQLGHNDSGYTADVYYHPLTNPIDLIPELTEKIHFEAKYLSARRVAKYKRKKRRYNR